MHAFHGLATLMRSNPEVCHLAQPSKLEADKFEYAGSASLGLAHEERKQLRAALHAARLDHRPRRPFLPVHLFVRQVVESHGRSDGQLRDPVIRQLML